MEPEDLLPNSKELAPARILSHLNPAQAPIPLPEDQFTIILPSTPGFSKWSLSFRFSSPKPFMEPNSVYVFHCLACTKDQSKPEAIEKVS